MASRGKKPAVLAKDWLLEPLGRPSGDTKREIAPDAIVLDEGDEQHKQQAQDQSIGTEAAQWLMEPLGRSNGRAIGDDERADEERAMPVAESGTRVDTKKLQKAKQALEEQGEKDAELAERITDLEIELRMQAKEAEETLARTLEEREAEFAAALGERDEAIRERETELKRQLSDRYEKRKADLSKDFNEWRAQLEDQMAALENGLDVREDEIREQAGKREAKLVDRIGELQEQLADAKLGTNEAPAQKRSRRGSKNAELDVNDVSFEQLRELGLSVTQSARLIAYRETRGGFDSLDELDEIPGLPKETRSALRSQLILSD